MDIKNPYTSVTKTYHIHETDAKIGDMVWYVECECNDNGPPLAVNRDRFRSGWRKGIVTNTRMRFDPKTDKINPAFNPTIKVRELFNFDEMFENAPDDAGCGVGLLQCPNYGVDAVSDWLGKYKPEDSKPLYSTFGLCPKSDYRSIVIKDQTPDEGTNNILRFIVPSAPQLEEKLRLAERELEIKQAELDEAQKAKLDEAQKADIEKIRVEIRELEKRAATLGEERANILRKIYPEKK